MPSWLDVDMSDDFVRRTLLLSPPSLSSHQELLTQVLKPHDRASTDLQMLDRVAAGLVSLPVSTYDAITILSDADASRRESQALISRNVLASLVQAMKPGAVLQSHDGQLGANEGAEKTEYILAGLTYKAGTGFVKPDYAAQESVPLRFGRKAAGANGVNGLRNVNGTNGINGINRTNGTNGISSNGTNGINSNGTNGINSNGTNSISTTNGITSTNGHSAVLPVKQNGALAGVGFDDGTDVAADGDSDSDDDDELIDEDTLLDEADMARPVRVRT
ncbi:hypothetical protein DV735_g613, partial [Chaetothyriales sp. CBS 134920]